MSPWTVESWRAGEIDREGLLGLAELHLAAFPPKGRTVDEYADKLEKSWGRSAGDALSHATLFLVREQETGRVIGKAGTYERIIGVDDALAGGGESASGEPMEMAVLALADVASAPDLRGQGIGEALVRASFARVDSGEFGLSLFQTSQHVKPFYEQLGCRAVKNQFVDSTDPATPPFRDEVVMVYEGASVLPRGVVDTRGPGW
ncbi:MAG: GNAT family N-acetyltransferase [Planctomycetota bacterium]